MTSNENQSSGECSHEKRTARVSLSQVVQGLGPEAEPSARAIALAVRHFNHIDVSIHDYEISLGSACHLCTLLDRSLHGTDASVLAETTCRGGNVDHNRCNGADNVHRWRSARIAMTCSALEMTLRCSTGTLRSFHRQFGSRVLMPAVTAAIDEFATSDDGGRRANATRLVLRSCSKIIRRLSDASIVLADGDVELRTILSLLLRVAQGGVGGAEGGRAPADYADVDADIFATLANLTCSPGTSRRVMTTYPGLLDVLVTPSQTAGPRRRYCSSAAARALRNLSRCETSRAALIGRGDVVEALAVWTNDPRRDVRRFAVVAAKNLSANCATAANGHEWPLYRRRRLIEALLRSLQMTDGSNHKDNCDYATRASCQRAIRSLLDLEEPAAIAEFVADALVRPMTSSRTIRCVGPESHLRDDTVATLMGHVRFMTLNDMPSNSRSALLGALMRVLRDAHTTRGTCAVVVRALEALSCQPQNRSVLARHGKLWNVLASLLRYDDEYVNYKAMACIRNLYTSPESVGDGEEGRVRVWPWDEDARKEEGDEKDQLLGTMIDVFSGALNVSDRTCDLCVRVMERWVQDSRNRMRFVPYYGLLVPSLVKFASRCRVRDESMKRAAILCIVRLSRERLIGGSMSFAAGGGTGETCEKVVEAFAVRPSSAVFAPQPFDDDDDSEWMDFDPDIFVEVEI